MKTKIVMQKLYINQESYCNRNLPFLAISYIPNYLLVCFEESKYFNYKHTPSGLMEHVEEAY